MSGGSLLSATSRSIVKPSVTTPSGTALAAAFAGIWSDMLARANAAGTPDPAAAIKELVSDTAFASNGDILPQNAAAYAALWDTLASGGHQRHGRRQGNPQTDLARDRRHRYRSRDG
ncbi:hypothetical protein Q1M64_19510 [Sinorhizobium meliloti]|nr:hypothetical protein Q1M64_19510 [Sinorhizobium meliloti]